MNTVNRSTGFTGFFLKSGFSPRVIPILQNEVFGSEDTAVIAAADVLSPIEVIADEVAALKPSAADLPFPTPSSDTVAAVSAIAVWESSALDGLIAAKVTQAAYANRFRAPEIVYKVGDKVMLNTSDRRKELKATNSTATCYKLMPRADRPFTVTATHPDTSNYTLHLPNNPSTYNVFHASKLYPFVDNDDTNFPLRTLARPDPISVDGEDEYYIDRIIDSQHVGCGARYLVRWTDYGPEEDRWLPASLLKDTVALDRWIAGKGKVTVSNS